MTALQPRDSRRLHALLAIAVAVVGAAVFAASLRGGWIFDDHPLIEQNRYAHSFAAWPRWFVTDFWNVSEEVVRFGSRVLYWRPGVTATYALDWTLSGGSPVLFHVTNLLWHALVGGLAFVVLRRWLGSTWPAVAAALLFAVHPTKAESVAWVAGRTDILCMAAVLIATQGLARRLRGAHGGIALEAAGTLLAYLCKEQAIVLPCFAAVEAWVAAGRPALDRASVIRMVRVAAPQAAIAIVYLAIRTAVLPIGPEHGGQPIPFVDHALAVLETLGRFIALTFAPHDLSIQQGLVHAIHHEVVHSVPYMILGVVVTAALIAAAIVARRRSPAITLGIALFFVTLAPTSNIVYTGMATLVSERFLYLPIFGLAWVAGSLLALAHRRWAYGIVAAAIVALGVLSVQRSSDFASEDAFWARELHMHPDSIQARLAAVTHDMERKHYRAALADLHTTTAFDDRAKEQIAIAMQIASLLSQLVPDHHVGDLEQIDRYAADVLAGAPVARLDVDGVHYTLELANLRNDRELKIMRPRFLALRADLQSRLGHDDAAIELAGAAASECQTCVTIVTMYALVLARAGRYDDALGLLDAVAAHVPEQPVALARGHITAARELHDQAAASTGPAALQAHASELAKLELWGRAYDLLAPYQAEIEKAPKFAVGYAELAFRAGEPEVARAVLAKQLPAAQVDAQLADWSRKMGWAE